jgi:glycosyltransferase involved in cell wall biosynthesis
VTVLPRSERWDRFPLAQARRLKQIRRLAKRYKPNVVHAYFFWPIVYARLLKQMGLVRWVVENREDQGFGWGRSEYALLKLTRRATDAMICVSEGVRQAVLEKEAVDGRRVSVVHNGIDVSVRRDGSRQAMRDELGLSRNHLVVGMVANFNRPVKGVTYFLDAIPLILASVPDARFLIVGRGKEQRTLVSKAERLGVAGAILFAGYCENVDDYYAAMDVSVLTSLSEGLSITLLESMSFGLPVVATRVGGNPEVVVDGETGYLVPPKDAEAFAAKVIRLLQNPALRRRMGDAGRKRVEERFRIEHAAAGYLRVYDQVLAAR